MTAAVAYADDPTLPIFRSAVDAYVAEHRGREHASVLSRNAQAAGLAAVRSWWDRHPGDQDVDLTGWQFPTSVSEKDRLKTLGYTCVGYGTFYVLAPPGWEPSTGESTDPASPVDGAL